VFIDKSQMPEIIEDGVRVKVVCGSSGEKNNPIATPDPLVILHVFVEPRKSFTHVLPANWSGTVLVVEGRCDVMLPEETVELDEGNVVSFGRSEIEEAITFNGITDSEVIFISGVPLNEKIFSQGAMAMGSQETLLQTLSDFKSGKMGNVTVEDGERKVIPPVEV
jgi:redox-sensitive bicupin YhaK (pirin superfamily)